MSSSRCRPNSTGSGSFPANTSLPSRNTANRKWFKGGCPRNENERTPGVRSRFFRAPTWNPVSTERERSNQRLNVLAVPFAHAWRRTSLPTVSSVRYQIASSRFRNVYAPLNLPNCAKYLVAANSHPNFTGGRKNPQRAPPPLHFTRPFWSLFWNLI
ncbi:hypothetical protein RSSM_02706 [Rhodopirellula sallentina SM41]|uniref:Uncharacterized protein n=1 Tax=Rhodopirellula sallentina SM41 TaxID=1263870 RepID=M5U3N6_9BACT|nr:hypothetical protein RSSM_02706 [Rhodopirellula sallentina SM41]